ncbi:MAG: mandelate racemase/muconate lactonizing enzyme family protein [Pseudomonadota bacterium]
MKITRISVYQVDLPMREGSYSWAGQTFAAFDSTVVAVETDAGVTGFGEVCPLGPSYLAAYAEGARTGIALLAAGLIGEDPREIDCVYAKMDLLLKGHPYAKSAVDMACWDILGKATDLPVYALLGGKFREGVKLFKVLSKAEPQQMADKLSVYRDMGYDQYQMKVGGEPALDIERILAVTDKLERHELIAADANTGWRLHEAMRVVNEIRGTPIYVEQPCLTYEECLAVRQHCDNPMILDECMEDLHTIIRGHNDSAMDVVNLKISRMGGLSKARQARDLCASLGIVMTIEDSWGGEIATTAIAHLSHSTPQGFHYQSSAFTEYNTVCIAHGGSQVRDGYLVSDDSPGLGVEANFSVLGNPVSVVE